MAIPASWEQVIAKAVALERAVRRSQAQNVNATALRSTARGVALSYFEEARGPLHTAGLSADTLAAVDREFQDLLRLASGQNARASYLRSLRALRNIAPTVATELVVRFGAPQTAQSVVLTEQETTIAGTLERLVPTASLSYRQALNDLNRDDRLSWRGTASDLREALRETLDHLAPDDDVKKTRNFKLEEGRTVPTMVQKVRFILRSRDTPSGAMSAPENTVLAIEALIGLLARSTYDRGSLDTHVAASRQEVRQLKRYVDTVLCDLLAIA